VALVKVTWDDHYMQEERKNPDLIVRLGGKKEMMKEAADRRRVLAQKAGVSLDEVDRFVLEFSNMRKMMVQQLKGMDLENKDPNAPMITMKEKLAQEKKNKKLKPSRGGGAGFGAAR
jgi:signal recognition particle GTPase